MIFFEHFAPSGEVISASETIMLQVEGALTSTSRTTITLVGAEQPLTLVTATDRTILVSASEDILPLVEGALISTSQTTVSLIGNEAAVSVGGTTDFVLGLSKQASSTLTPNAEGALASFDDNTVTLIGGEQSVSLGQSTSFSTKTPLEIDSHSAFLTNSGVDGSFSVAGGVAPYDWRVDRNNATLIETGTINTQDGDDGYEDPDGQSGDDYVLSVTDDDGTQVIDTKTA